MADSIKGTRADYGFMDEIMSYPATYPSVEAFAAEMRERDPDGARDLSRRGYFSTGATTSSRFTVTGDFHATYDTDAFWALFDRDGKITVGVDPAKPAVPDDWTDTIPPLENL